MAAAAPASTAIRYRAKVRLKGIGPVVAGQVRLEASAERDVHILRLQPAARTPLPANEELAITADALPQLAEGVQIWRYKPWNSWTKPMHVGALEDLASDDIQLLYWRDEDGVYGAAVPLSGHGFRTTLGRIAGKLAARAVAFAPSRAPADIAMMAVGHGPDPHHLIAATYRAALTAMGRQEHGVQGKAMPEQFHYLGWNSWNASNLGKDLTEKLMFSAARTLKEAGVPVGWMTVDDGYLQHRESRLLSFDPDPAKFPNGMGPMIKRLKSEYGIRFVGVWLAFNGYWHGIEPEGEVGRAYGSDLFNWRELQDRTNAQSALRTDSFVRPDRPALRRYYDEHLGRRRAEGFDFVKVDHQSAVERMAVGNFPIWQLATAMHEEMNRAAAKHFDKRSSTAWT
jgi:raffinose synthase